MDSDLLAVNFLRWPVQEQVRDLVKETDRARKCTIVRTNNPKRPQFGAVCKNAVLLFFLHHGVNQVPDK